MVRGFVASCLLTALLYGRFIFRVHSRGFVNALKSFFAFR